MSRFPFVLVLRGRARCIQCGSRFGPGGSSPGTVERDISVKVKSKLEEVGWHMQIGDLARATGTSARSIRHYEAKGLVASTRLDNGYRDYADDTVERVGRIRALLRAGMSLAEIHPLISCLADDKPTLLRCETSVNAVAEHLARLNVEIAKLEQARTLLEAALPDASSLPPARLDAVAL